jgi:glycosyltransferase involved in cell wall biosynthesis
LIGARTDVAIFAAQTDDPVHPDGPNVLRDWTEFREWEPLSGNLKRLAADIERQGCGAVVVQVNYVFFDFGQLAFLLRRLAAAGRVAVVELHATHERDTSASRQLANILPELRGCDRVVVHSIDDLNRLKDLGLTDNVALLPLCHPHQIDRAALAAARERPRHARHVVATYGFFLPTTGLLQLIEAFVKATAGGFDGHLLMANAEYPADISPDLIAQARASINRLGVSDRVTMINDYLSDAESLELLRSADLIAMPYLPSTTDSASAAIGLCLASGRPVVVTPIPIFDDLGDAALRFPGCGVDDLARGLAAFAAEAESGSPRMAEVAARADALLSEHSAERLSARLFGMVESLSVNRAFDRFVAQGGTKPGFALPLKPREFLPPPGQMQSAVGRLDDRRAFVSTGRPGNLTYGPYCRIEPGRYRLRAFGSLGGPPARGRGCGSRIGTAGRSCAKSN